MTIGARRSAVVIGRNEGPRLESALRSVQDTFDEVVYVDSASSDASPATAAACGVAVVELPADGRLSAARARNAGFHALHEPSVVLFMDGDCTLEPGFADEAAQVLANDGVVAVCGTRRERRPERNWLHRICAVEWRTGGTGDVAAFGGDVLVDAAAFAAAGGYDEALIAGEDPELSARLRDAGGRIIRLDRDATVHDIDMTRVGQWWKRAERAGWAYGAVFRKRRGGSDPMYQREVIRTLIVPVALAVGVAGLLRGRRWPLALVGARVLVAGLRAGSSAPAPASTTDRVAWGLSCALAPLPGSVGVLRALAVRSHPELIEYH